MVKPRVSGERDLRARPVLAPLVPATGAQGLADGHPLPTLHSFPEMNFMKSISKGGGSKETKHISGPCSYSLLRSAADGLVNGMRNTTQGAVHA